MEKENKANAKSFVPANALAVIAIIGILSIATAAYYSNESKKKAADDSFKSAVSSIHEAAALCCDTGTPVLRGTLGTAVDLTDQTICMDPSGFGSYASNKDISTVKLNAQCSVGSFSITVYPPSGFKGTLASGTCTEDGCSF